MRAMNIWAKGAGAALLLALGTAAPARAETLADALIAAYQNSDLLDQNRALLRAADEDVASAVAQHLRPVINFVIGGGQWKRNRGSDNQGGIASAGGWSPPSLQLTAEMTLYDSGRGRLSIESAKEAVLATRAALVDIEQNVLIQAVQAYVNVKLASEVLFLRQSNIRLVTEESRAARERFEVGENTRTDVAVAEARLAQARADLAAAEGDLVQARASYELAVGHAPEGISTLPRSPALPGSVEEAIALARRGHPAIARAQHEAKAAEFGLQRAVRQSQPTIGANVTATDSTGAPMQSSDYPADSQSFTLGLTYSQTLYSGGQLSAIHRRAIAQLEAARAGVLQRSRQVEQGVAEAWSNLQVASLQIDATNRQVAAAREAFEGLREEARLGARTVLEVLNAEQDLLNAQVANAQAVAERDFGAYVVLQSMGLLTVDHLELGIPTYDAAAYYRAVKDAPIHTPYGRKLDRILRSVPHN